VRVERLLPFVKPSATSILSGWRLAVTRVLAKQYDLLRTQIQIDLIEPHVTSDDGLTLS
jgi:hypothetical protein